MNPCATGEQLRRFLRDELERHDNEAVATHIEECESCQRTLEQLTAACAESAQRPSIPVADEVDISLIDRLKAGGPPLFDPGADAEVMADRGRRDSSTMTSRSPDDATLADRGSESRALPTIQGFRILREIGSGGMGVVYAAQDEQLNRLVALKVLSAHGLMQSKQFQRFDQEAKAAARLHHTQIVPVFGVGQQNGYHYYVMQYIEGVGLDRVIDELRRREEEGTELGSGHSSKNRPELSGLSSLTAVDGRPYGGVARVGLYVAEALHYAHRQGILHRDIKPSNLLLDPSGSVWVTDFGLAKMREAEDLTSSGDVLGTVRYMAPERFRGCCDARSDVYALGLTLYELVALRPAFEASDRYELIAQVRSAETTRLGKQVPGIPRDLETIIHKAIAPEPDQRYATAGALVDDLRRFLEDRPIQARRPSISEQMVRWCRRNPWAAAFLLALGIGLVASTWEALRATAAERASRQAEIQTRTERDQAELARNRATTAERDARQAEALSRKERDRAERSRNRALTSVRELILLISGVGVPAQSKAELRFYQTRLIEVARRVTRDLEEDRGPLPELVHAYRLLAFLQGKDEQNGAALESARRAVAVAESVFAQERSAANGAAVESALHFLGSLTPDRDEKLSAFRQVATVGEALLAESPNDQRAQWLGMIVGGLIQVGYWECQYGRFREAIAALLKARAWGNKLRAEIGPRAWGCFSLADIEYQLCRAYR
jgi:serine/threonine protein kinase